MQQYSHSNYLLYNNMKVQSEISNDTLVVMQILY